MSFCFAIGGFIAVGQLAWTLYHQCYLVARRASQEFQHLLGEISMLSQAIQLLQKEAENPQSTLVRAGEGRARMVNEMMRRVEVTLKELEKYVKRYEKLGDTSQPKGKQIWHKFRWSKDAPDLDFMRNKVIIWFDAPAETIILPLFAHTDICSSSLERIENATNKIERRLIDIKTFIRKGEGNGIDAPKVSRSIGDDEIFGLRFSVALLKSAETPGRWAAIGIDQWIPAGRWWLMKAQMEIDTRSPSDATVPQGGYMNLVKASWILVDVIARHPQSNVLDSDVQFEVQLLVGMIRKEFRKIESSGLRIPDLQNLSEQQFQIWEIQQKDPTLQPGDTASDATLRTWMIADEHIIFQR
ncbi:hypothetical protein K440DRAFT_557690 [Wilcoxina mikolae CBS 423.85]|nr:hypothetical protein K440DRAFT_557690 [Wilcoxina mikolae CBS 423.85]